MLFRTDQTPPPPLQRRLELDLGTVEPTALAHSVRRIASRCASQASFTKVLEGSRPSTVAVRNNGNSFDFSSAPGHSAITSCTQHIEPSLMRALACWRRKLSMRGLHVNLGVKTSLRPVRSREPITCSPQETPYLEN